MNLDPLIRAIQKAVGAEPDGKLGPDSLRRIYKAVTGEDWAPETAVIPQESVDLILEFEGLDQPGRWPGEASGITLGHGFDLRFNTPAELEDAWGRHLDPKEVQRLSVACQKGAEWAQSHAAEFRDIRVTEAQAAEVFARVTLPKYADQTLATFPRGVDLLPPLAFGALVSLVFNRGPGVVGERRRHMAKIKTICADAGVSVKERCQRIADQIRAMIPLWEGRPIYAGMKRRREAEAKMVESAVA